MTSDPNSIALSLVSHTNAGKTTLARTLLGRDVGLVRDAPHVTEFADVFTLLQTPQGEQLKLWDTPGFGDSVRLVKRLQASGHPLMNPLGWFMSEVWDRWRDRAFWASQQAMRNVRDEADVLLYLVNASETPEAAGYVNPEMELLGWTGKPVIVLLNQLGAPREGRLEAQEIALWQTHLARFKHVKNVLPLDAFARCWVQEGTLLQEIENVLPAERQAMMTRLRSAWQNDKLRTFDAAMKSLASSVARLATATQALPEAGGVRARLKQLGASVGLGLGVGSADQTPSAVAQRALAEQLDLEVRANTLELIQLHGLEGQAQGEILTRLATHFELRLRMDEGKAALWGGMVSGALAGLKADLATGGLTLGGGLLAGGVLGALTAAGTAHGVNRIRGLDQPLVAWDERVLNALLSAALLGYLAVAHHGRGRGAWVQQDPPSAWTEAVAGVVAEHQDAIDELWPLRQRALTGRAFGAADQTPLQNLLQGLLCELSAELLARLYPDAPPIKHAARG